MLLVTKEKAHQVPDVRQNSLDFKIPQCKMESSFPLQVGEVDLRDMLILDLRASINSATMEHIMDRRNPA